MILSLALPELRHNFAEQLRLWPAVWGVHRRHFSDFISLFSPHVPLIAHTMYTIRGGTAPFSNHSGGTDIQ